MATAASPGCSAAWPRRRNNVGLAAKARVEGASTLRKPLLTGGCVCNVGLPVLSRPSPGSANVRFQAGASITANFRFGSNCDLRHASRPGLECADEPTFRPERRQCSGERT